MGRRQGREQQEELFYATEQAETPGHPFYERLNRVLEQAQFDRFCEETCGKFYHTKLGRPSLAPGVYFRALLIGFFDSLQYLFQAIGVHAPTQLLLALPYVVALVVLVIVGKGGGAPASLGVPYRRDK